MAFREHLLFQLNTKLLDVTVW